MARDPTWDFQDPASKGRLLGVLQREIDKTFELAAEPARWHTPTACPGWEVRDMVGHLLDATLSYRSAFDTARRGVAAEEPVGVAGMAQASDEAARAFRRVPRDELLAGLLGHRYRCRPLVDQHVQHRHQRDHRCRNGIQPASRRAGGPTSRPS